jgi:hypothetical protein
MPIKITCSRCGCTNRLAFVVSQNGQRLTSQLFYDSLLDTLRSGFPQPIFWRVEPCPECHDVGKVEELTFDERRRQAEDLQDVQEASRASLDPQEASRP